MAQYEGFHREINYYETDRMGVVHHSNYIRFLEESRMDFFKAVGMNYAELEQMGIMIPVYSVSCKYVTPARFGDTIIIYPRFEEFRGARFRVSYKIVDEKSGELRCTAESVHCFVDDRFELINLKTKAPDVYQMFINVIENQK